MQLNFLKNKNILVTGGTGSIGSALVFKLIKLKCNVVRVMSNDENSLFELSNAINEKFLIDINFKNAMENNKIRFFLGDVRDRARCREVTRNVDLVIHAAALKHVGISEYNPKEAMQTNVQGTKNIFQASVKNGVSNFLFISTDKVVNAKTIMGKSKQLAEKYIINAKQINKKKMKVAVVRFGNVLGSRGSVIPKFISSIKKNRKILVTHEKMARFVMSTEQAVNSILKSIKHMKGNDIFIFKSMKCFKIKELAYALAKYYKVSKNKVQILNKKTNEKFEEELFSLKELMYLRLKADMLVISNKKNLLSQNKLSDLDSYRVSNFNFLNKNQIIKLLIKNKIL